MRCFGRPEEVAKTVLFLAVQMTTAIHVYIPAAKTADRVGRTPFVVATFVEKDEQTLAALPPPASAPGRPFIV